MHFEVVSGRGMHRRVMCYTCQPVNGDRKTTYRNKHMKRKYGITVADYARMYNHQGGGCAICRTTIKFTGDHMKSGVTRNSEDPCVDHCHTTGIVRGILCFHCNTALGHVFDDTDRLRQMINYLEENR